MKSPSDDDRGRQNLCIHIHTMMNMNKGVEYEELTGIMTEKEPDSRQVRHYCLEKGTFETFERMRCSRKST